MTLLVQIKWVPIWFPIQWRKGEWILSSDDIRVLVHSSSIAELILAID